MKKFRTVLITLLGLSALSLSGCSRFFSLLFGENLKVTDLESTHFNNTYNDYMNNNLYRLDGTPLTGNSKILVVPIWFTDSNNYISNKTKVKEDIQKAYFGTTSQVGWESVTTYYNKLSNGKLNLTGVVADWYEVSQPSSYYYSSEQGAKRTASLVNDAAEHYRISQGLSNLSEFDTDNNGYVDGVVLIYGSPDYGALKDDNASNMWAYCFWTQVERGTSTNPVPNTFFWASYDFLYGKESNMGAYYSGDTKHCTLDTHTYIHETGHMLGLEDYYDYSGQCTPAGGFSMQDYNVGSHDPYSVMAFGWADPMIPKDSCTLSLKPFQSSHSLILLSPNPNQISSPFDEYLLLEYYTPDGLNAFDNSYSYLSKYPQGANKAGIRCWHVDARLLATNSREGDIRVTFANSIVSGKYYTHAMSNTYYSDDFKDYISPLGEEYANYNILQLIRNNTRDDYKNDSLFADGDLFGNSSSFSMKNQSKQFVNKEKLNSGTSLGWTFKVNKISEEEALVTVTRI